VISAKTKASPTPRPVKAPKIVCRLNGCSRVAKAEGEACYGHRSIAADVTDAPMIVLCDLAGCDRRVKTTQLVPVLPRPTALESTKAAWREAAFE
jgi:hypothetical protein